MLCLANMKAFVLWFFEELPDFLLSEPVCYLIGFVFALFTLYLIKKIINLT